MTEIAKDQDMMLEAQANVLNAREEARKTIEQIYEKSRYPNTLDETLVRIFGETEQSISRKTTELLTQNSTDAVEKNKEENPSQSALPDKLPIDIYPEIRKITTETPIGPATDAVSEEDIRKEIETFIEEAIRIKKEAQQALNEADIIRQAARLTVNRAKQDALKTAEDEIARSQEEAEAARNHARIAITLAQDKVKKTAEFMAQVREENRKIKESAEMTRQEAAEVVRQSREESRIAREKADASIKKVNEQITRARQLITESSLQEDNAIQPTRKKITDAETGNHETPLESPQTDSVWITDDILKEMYDPLHSISGFARMMLDDNIADRAAQKEFLNIILEQTETLKQRLDALAH